MFGSFTSAEIARWITEFYFAVFFMSFFAQAFSIALYVMESIGIYSIAKRRQIKKPWLAWFPVANLWLMGSISDQYQYVVKGRVRNRRKIMLTMGILLIPVTIFYAGSTFSTLLEMAMRISGPSGDLGEIQQMIPQLITMGVFAVATLVLSIALMVFQWMSLYDLYSSCIPKHNVLFLILSIFISATRPFFIFFNREKDEGMPPRKADYTPQDPTWQTN